VRIALPAAAVVAVVIGLTAVTDQRADPAKRQLAEVIAILTAPDRRPRKRTARRRGRPEW
jgi:hypothetical protein